MTVPFGLLTPDDLRPTPPFVAGGADVAPPAPHRSIGQRLLERALPVPRSMQGLVGEDDIKFARKMGLINLGAGLLAGSAHREGDRPSFAAALGQGIQQGVGAYSGALDQGVARHAAGQELQQKQALLNARAQIMAKYQIPEGASPAVQNAAIKGMFTEFMRLGDTEMVGKMASVVGALEKDAKGKDYIRNDIGGSVQYLDPATLQVVKTEKKTPSPRDPNSATHAEELSEQRRFSRETQLVNQYNGATDQYSKVADNIGVLRATIPAAVQGNPQAQMGLIFAYMKLLDPGSTVREGEYATAQNAAGVPDKVRNEYNKAKDGGFLTPEQVRSFATRGEEQATQWRTRLGTVRKGYQQRAARWGIDPEAFVDYFGDAPAAPAAAGPAPAGQNVKQAIGGIR